jgi:cell wall-associated NlpC family hydrolase
MRLKKLLSLSSNFVMITRFFIVALVILLAQPAPLRAEESLGQAIKEIFATPTPTPKPRKTKKPSATAKKSPTSTPSPSKKKLSPPEKESPTLSPTSSPGKKKTPLPAEETPSPTPRKKKASPTASPSASRPKKKTSPSPEPFETPESPAPTPTATLEQSPTATAPNKHGAPATLSPDQIKGFSNYPPKVQRLLAFALDLTARNLDYKYGSADPANGGMDCSGFVYFVLKQNEITDVPRDSSEQYNWLRRARVFEPVLSEKEDSFELEDLKPGDLLFWTGTYAIDRDPPITHSMIYLGREKKTGKRVMVGSSDGRVYEGESRFGVSVFDFNVHRAKTTADGKLHPVFIGYAHVPGLDE